MTCGPLKTYKSNDRPCKRVQETFQEVEGLLMPRGVLGLSIREHPSVVSYALSSSGTCGLLPVLVCVSDRRWRLRVLGLLTVGG